MKALIQRLLGFAVGSFGAALLNLITIPVVTFFISPEEYGKTSMFMLAQTLLICIIYWGYDQALTREFYDYPRSDKLFATAISIPLVAAGIIIVMLVGFANPLAVFLFGSASYYKIVWAIAASIILMIFERFLFLFIRMENKAFEFSFFNILVKLSILVCTVLFLQVFPTNFVTVVYAMIFGQMLGDFLLTLRNLKLLCFSFKKN
ncbi:lipopolysaccharide biosynthesis protein [Listeria floridensis]|uniref:lipopolysaccharide biosynthesis protein n=1 Tax=Listeria floridensis TaxID=1494962 RepID=UPI001F4CF62A|nr:oligosaccharide flippase family protein [Listeria floridensis]